MKTLITLMIAGLMFVGCAEKTETLGSAIQTDPKGDPLPVGHPELELPPASREINRITVDMLAAGIKVVAGKDASGVDITWIEKAKNEKVKVLEGAGLTKTLGKPDYIQVTEEPAKPTALYLKFMDDMARNVCAQMLESDAQKTDANDRSLVRFAKLDDVSDAAAINENLRYLKLRFWGEKVADGDDGAVTNLKTLFDTAAGGAKGGKSATEGWRAVCVGLFSAPAFHLY